MLSTTHLKRFIETMAILSRIPLLAGVLGLALACNFAAATPYTPNHGAQEIASWTVSAVPTHAVSLDELRDAIAQGQYPGQADTQFGRVKAQLLSMITRTPSDPETWYLYARVLQHQHQFDLALEALDRAIALKPSDANAFLLKASIHMIQGDTQAAKQACMAMLGQAAMLTVSACALEAASHDGNLVSSYRELKRLSQLSPPEDEQQALWIAQILADMAMRQARPDEALSYFSQVELARAPVSLLALWADILLANHRPDEVLTRLTPIVNAHSVQDDALLLRLAIAEKSYPPLTHWQTSFAQRVALRELRQDSAHAADLARYYLDVNVQPDKALFWAEINWHVARLSVDRALLERAQTQVQ